MPRKTSRKKIQLAVETSESIALQTAEFLKAGGAVEIIGKGVSGRELMVRRKYTLYAKK